jgi:hypothetical protein
MYICKEICFSSFELPHYEYNLWQLILMSAWWKFKHTKFWKLIFMTTLFVIIMCFHPTNLWLVKVLFLKLLLKWYYVPCTITPKHGFDDYDNLWLLLFYYSHVIVFHFKLWPFFLLWSKLCLHDYKYDYKQLWL